MHQKNVMKTKKLNLCLSCQICEAVCPKNCISMEYGLGQFLPKIDINCIDCGLCLKICPGMDLDPLNMGYEKEITDTKLAGNVIKSYTAYSKNLKIRPISTSGGLITTLIAGLIENKKFDAAFVLPFDYFKNEPVQLKAVNQIDEILSSAKSKYIPASAYKIIEELKKGNDSKYIIVGTPCLIRGVKNYLKNNKINYDNLLFLGLFCDRTLNYNIIKYYENKYSNSEEKIIKFEFRTKENNGWPGNSKICFDSGRELIVDRDVRVQLKKYFQLNRCLFCYDKLNQMADISFGDCYLKEKEDFNGKSSVIIRTKKGEEIFNEYSYLFEFEDEKIEDICKSQNLIGKKENIDNMKIFYNKCIHNSEYLLDFDIHKAEKNLSKLQKYVHWGITYNVRKIKLHAIFSKIVNKLETVGKFVIIFAILGIAILKDIIPRNNKEKARAKRNVIIVGGGLFNKGAQAMTFTTVDQIKRRFPNKEIYLFSTDDFERRKSEKELYKFNILPWDLKIKFELLNYTGVKVIKNKYSNYMEDIKNIIKDADIMVDISGYTLSSQWGFMSSLRYLLNLMIAKKESVRYYILPQSIGPFNYHPIEKIFVYPLFKLYLKYPEKIFAREEEGLKCVQKFTKKNAQKGYDIVLVNRGYIADNIYNNVCLKSIQIKQNSVGIIPNKTAIGNSNPDQIYEVYKSIINKLNAVGKTVYILRHSYEDLQICKKIKAMFPNNGDVMLISEDLSAIELENIIKQFDFVIASRYHSIIHSYKNGVPVIAMGWATKYHELLNEFGQLDYFFDVRFSIPKKQIEDKLSDMISNYKNEKIKIIEKINKMDEKRIYDSYFY